MDYINITLTKSEASVVSTFIRSTLQDIKDSGIKPDPTGSQIIVSARNILKKIDEEVDKIER